MSIAFIFGSGGGTGAVDSVFGRTGAVIATSGDYSVGLVSGAAATSPTAEQVFQPSVDAVPVVSKCFNGTNTANCFEVRSKAGAVMFGVANDGTTTFGGAGAGSTQWTTGAMSVSAASSVKVGAHTGNILAVSKNGGTVTEVLDKSLQETKSFTILVPTAADTFLVKMAFAQAITIVRFYCSTDTGTATMNAEERAEATPNTAGTDVLSADIVCDSGTRTSCASGCDVNTISNGTIAAHAPLAFEIVSVASAPQVVNVHIDYTID